MTRILKRKRLLSLVLALSLLITLMPPLSIPGYSEELTDNAELATSDSGFRNYGAAIGAVAQWNNVTSVLLASNHFESKGDVCAGVSVNALPKKLAIVDYAYNDANAVLWYKVDAAPGYTWPEEYANYHWVDSYTIRIVSQNGMTGVFDAEGNPVTEATVSTTETVTVKAETSLQSADITYKWQICYDTVNDLWVDITGNDSAEITLTAGMAISLMDENDQVLVRCVTSVGSKRVTSAPIAVTLQQKRDVEEAAPADYSHMTRKASVPSTDFGIAPVAETTTTYNVIIQYLDEQGEHVVADPYTSVVSPTTILTNTISFPRVLGYEPHVYKDGNWVRQNTYTFDGTPFTDDFTLEVRYFPGSVDYKVNIYIQNAENDEYTLMTSYVGHELTGTVLDKISVDVPGCYQSRFSSNYAAIAADGSTVFNLHYDRIYYLMKFDLDGGYGVYPIYARHGAKLDIPNPTKAGYSFIGWDQTEGTPAVSDQTLNDGIPNTMYEYMPIGNTAYKAKWKEAENAKVTIVYWGENPNDEKYSYLESQELYVKPGTELTFGTNKLVCTLTPHTHGSGCTYNCGKTPHTHSLDNNPSCYQLTCTTKSHNHKESGCQLTNCKHTHITDCYNFGYDRLHEISMPSATLTNVGNGIYTYKRNAYIGGGTVTCYCLNLDGKWYQGYMDSTQITISCKHAHTDVCYSCGKNVGTHVHSLEQECYTLTCQTEAHTHSDTCYSCIAHTHTDDCYLKTNRQDATKYYYVKSDTVTVAVDGSTVMNVYYDRVEYAVEFHKNQDCTNEYTDLRITAKWGASILNKWPTYNGSSSWRVEDKSNTWQNSIQIMPIGGAKFWGPKTGNSSDKAYYYVEALPGATDTIVHNGVTYVLHHTDVSSSSGDVTDEERYGIEGFKYKEGTSNGTSYNNAKFYYVRETYLLEFNNGEGIVKTESVKYQYGLSSYAFQPKAPSKYEPGSVEFAGWYQNPECTGDEVKLDKTTMPSSKMILYAKWVPVKHDVTVYRYRDAAGKLHDLLCNHTDESIETEQGEVPGLGSISHGELLNKHYIPKKPTNGNYNFVTWAYYDKDLQKEVTIDINNFVVTKDVEIYAKWSSNVQVPYTIKYMIEGTTTEIAAPSEGKHYAGETHTFNAKTAGQLYADYRTGYFPTITSHSIDFKTGDSSYEPIFYYVKKDAVPYTVYYVTNQQNATNSLAEIKLTEDGEEKTYYILADTKQVNDNKNAIVTENFKKVPGYMPDAYQKTLIIDGSDGANNQIVFKYSADKQHAYYKVTHYTKQIDGTWFAHASQETVGTIGETIHVDPMNIEGFTHSKTEYKVGDNAPTKTNSALTADGLEINLYYERNKYPYTVQYVLQGSTENTVLYTETFQDQYYGDTVYHEAPEHYGTGNIYKRTSAEKLSTVIQTDAAKNVITFYYVEQEVTIKYAVANGLGGTVNPSQETVLIKSEDAKGSVAAPLSSAYKFVGWYDEQGNLRSTELKFVPEKVDGLNVTATYHAKFEYNLTSLTIVKNGVDKFKDIDPNQSFVFDIYDGDTDTLVTTVTVNSTTDWKVVVDGLTVGKLYKVTEKTDWSWRYNCTGWEYEDSNATVTGADHVASIKLGVGGTITFTNTRDNEQWLDGDSWCNNIFK